MVPESTASTTVDRADRYGSDNSLVNALIGAGIGIVLSFIPLSPMLGGAVAGYLESGDTDDGLRVGAIAGLVMLLPFMFFGFLMMLFMGFALGGGSPLTFFVVAMVMLVFGALYTVGLSAVGGLVGIYIEDEL